MVLAAIVGELGTGKTLLLTYIMWKKYLEGMTIYSNYHLNKSYIPKYNFVDSASDIDNMTEGIFGGDELWLWLDSRESPSKKNKFIASILIKSRKRGIDILYTTQSFMQIDIRVRRITDFVIEPVLTKNNTVCRAHYYKTPNWVAGAVMPIRSFKFYAPSVWDIYDTREEVKQIK